MGKISRCGFLKFLMLGAIVCIGLFIFGFTHFSDLLTPEYLGRLLEDSGFWAPLIFMVLHGITICLFLPASLMVLAGGVIFGTSWGFVYSWVGCLAGASGAFFLSRSLGTEFFHSILWKRFKKYEAPIERNGFLAVFYLRLFNVPFTPLNFALGLTNVRYRDFLSGTGTGMLAGLLVFSILGGTLKQVWTNGKWEELFTTEFFISLTIMAFSLLIPLLIKKGRGTKIMDNE